MILAKRFHGGGAFNVPAAGSGAALPAGPNLIAPGCYTFRGAHFDCSAEGLYRFVEHGVETAQKIVYSASLYAFMSAMAWISSHGKADQGKAPTTLNAIARTSKLRLGCNHHVAWVKYWVDYLGYPNRIVRLLTAQAPNGYFDGHVAIEVQRAGAWELWDVNRGQIFTDAQGQLSMRDLFAALEQAPGVLASGGGSGLTVEAIARDHYSVEPNVPGSFDVTAFMEMEDRTQAQKNGWNDRIYQIPGLDHTDGLSYFYLPPGTEARQSWVLGLSSAYRVVSKASWLSMFYGAP